MIVLLDECIPRKLKYSLPDHDCRTMPESGFAGKKNGALLGLAESSGFEIFVTMDKGIARAEPCGKPGDFNPPLQVKSPCRSPSIGAGHPVRDVSGPQRRGPPHRQRRQDIVSLRRAE